MAACVLTALEYGNGLIVTLQHFYYLILQSVHFVHSVYFACNIFLKHVDNTNHRHSHEAAAAAVAHISIHIQTHTQAHISSSLLGFSISKSYEPASTF